MDENSPSSEDTRHLHIAEADAGGRLDRTLAAHLPDLSRARLQTLIRAGQVALTRDGTTRKIEDPSAPVKPEDAIAITLPPPADTHIAGQAMPLAILHEDDDLIVLDKPAGLVVHPGAGNPDHTLVNALIAHCGDSLSGIGGEKRPGIVHRLDKDTSGVLVAAKTDRAHQGLSAQFAAHGRDGRLTRIYELFVWGQPMPASGKIETGLGRAPHNRRKMAVSNRADARHAITHYTQIAPLAEGLITRLACRLETGRTHQIRVHMAYLGHPAIGDKLYGAGMATRAKRLTPPQSAAIDALGRQALHAKVLAFEHPVSGEAMRFETPLPPDMARLAAALGA